MKEPSPIVLILQRAEIDTLIKDTEYCISPFEIYDEENDI